MWFAVEQKKKVHGTKWRGYCPFSALGRDITGGVTTRAVWRAHGKCACVHDRAATRVAAHATAPAPVNAHNTGVEYAT